MSFNPRDPYDAAALYDMWLNCNGCTSTFDFEPNQPISLGYYHEIGQQAKVDGWFVSEQTDFQDEEGVTWLVLCPCCSEKYGLTPEDAYTSGPKPIIEEICQAMRKAEKKPQVA